MKKIKETIKTILWSLRLALHINAKLFLLWGTLSVALSVLPAVALIFNRRAVSILSSFLLTGEGTFSDIVPSLITLGIVMIAIGLSKRLNGNFLYFVMYDAYYFGLEEFLMDTVNRIELKTLMDKNFRDEHYACIGRCGSLSDFMSSSCLFLSKFIGAISLLVVAANTSFIIFIISATYIVAVIILNIFMAGKVRWDSRPYQAATRLSNYYQGSTMSPGVAKELRVYDLSKETVEKWDNAYEAADKIDRHFVKMRQLVTFISSISFYIFIIIMLGYCILRVADGEMSVDVFLMLYAMGQSISEVAQIMSSSFQEMDRGLYFLDIQRKFTQSVPQTQEDWNEGFTPADQDIAFSAENVCFSYDDKKEVLHNLNFEIKKGETIALVGLNGSGKTTLVKLLIGLFSPTAGKLRFYGNEYDSRTRGAVIHRVGMFFQDFHIFHATLRENVGFGDIKKLPDTERIKLAMEKGGADHLIEKLPEGLDGWLMRDVKREGIMLSGGEKQRIAVSRAHMSDKEILIFDRVGFARLADRILLLDKGKLVESGTHEELIAANGIYAGMYHEQALWYQRKDSKNE